MSYDGGGYIGELRRLAEEAKEAERKKAMGPCEASIAGNHVFRRFGSPATKAVWLQCLLCGVAESDLAYDVRLAARATSTLDDRVDE